LIFCASSGRRTTSPIFVKLHHRLALPLPKGVGELRLAPTDDEAVEPRLFAELVYPLSDFVSRRIAKTGGNRQKALEIDEDMCSEDDAGKVGECNL